MQIATVILTHDNLPLTSDTVDSVATWVGNRILVLVDEVGWPIFQNIKINNTVIEEGFYHAHKRSPYRNYVLGLKKLYKYWPDSEWFLYLEYDCLFTSDGFKSDLQKAKEKGSWCVGVDLRRFDFQLPLLQKIIDQGPIKYSYYFLGCCHFLHRKLVEKIHQINFIDNLLEQTKYFTKGHFPNHERFAFEEEMIPTLSAHLGGKLYELSCWKDGDWQKTTDDSNMIYAGIEHESWRGKFKKYPIRNDPPITNSNIYPETCIIHPVKSVDDPIRLCHKNKRNLIRRKQIAIF